MRRKISKSGGGGPRRGQSLLQEHLSLIPEEHRTRVADLVGSMRVRTYEDLTDMVMFVTSEVIRGTISAEVAEILTGLIEIAFTSVAASNRGEESSRASSAITSLVEALSNPAAPAALPSYHVMDIEPEERPTVVIDIREAKGE